MAKFPTPRLIRPSNPPGIFRDARGLFTESWRVGGGVPAMKSGLTSFSKAGVLRGLHYQRTKPRTLIVRPVIGIIWDVALDLRKDSPTYGSAVSTRLNSESCEAGLIPAGFAHGFYAMTDALVIYECSELFDEASFSGIKWNDPQVYAAWSGIVGDKVQHSEKDLDLPSFADTAPIEV